MYHHYFVGLFRSQIRPSLFRLCSTVSGVNSFTYRTHNCGQLRLVDSGQHVTLCGWLLYRRHLGKIVFLSLRDSYGLIQVHLPEDSKYIEITDKLPHESVLKVSGYVRPRPDKDRNAKLDTGDVEVVLEDLEILNKAVAKMPYEIREQKAVADHHVRLKYRYLELRKSAQQLMLRTRSTMVAQMRNFLLEKCNFVEVETPLLFRRTPGGAAEFIVPSSEEKGLFYSLPQSPQQFKQLLMVGGVDRYFQVARCFRDEGSKPDRQPEFTQIDLEMSFTDQQAVMSLIEQLIDASWPNSIPSLAQFPPKLPFPRMTYEVVMKMYGIDKPDTRFEMKLIDLAKLITVEPFADWLKDTPSPSVQCIVGQSAADHVTNKNQSEFKEQLELQSFSERFAVIKVIKDLHWQGSLGKKIALDIQRSVSGELGLKDGDLVIICWGSVDRVRKSLGYLRLKFADLLETKGVKIRKPGFNFLWVTDFPLFLKDDTTGQLESGHHPFTAPVSQHEELLYESPEKVIGQHYDLVLNGVELGGGSIRIHNSEMQRFVLESVLKEDADTMSHLLEALSVGAPPHGGIALGLDRYLALLLGYKSIRDVIAFPKSSTGRDLMSGAPAIPSETDLKRYGITVISEEN